MKIFHSKIETRLGLISVFALNNGLVRISIGTDTDNIFAAVQEFNKWKIEWDCANDITLQTCEQLKRYFKNELTFFNVPLYLIGTPFQKKVWKELRKIPFGEVRSYQQIAVAIKNPLSVRAVGNANGRNPIPIIIPCHRVVRKDGHLGGFTGGVQLKDWLLRHEGISINLFKSKLDIPERA